MLVKVIDSAYVVENEGYRGSMPIIHLFGRDPQKRRKHIEVEGFRPYFLVPRDEWLEKGTAFENDDRIIDVSFVDEQDRQERRLDDTPLVRVICRTPRDVPKLRDNFDHVEGDVPFTDRFLIDHDINQWMRVPDDCEGMRLQPDDVESADRDSDVPDEWIPPRVCVFDIEVKQNEDTSQPSVVSKKGTELAQQPITAITAYDSYTAQYFVWVTAHPSWDDENIQAVESLEDELDDVTKVVVCTGPNSTPTLFVEHVNRYNYDVLTGWNSNNFDVPYLVNYLKQKGIPQVDQLCPITGEGVEKMDGDGKWINRDLDGRILFDLLTGYDKANIHELDSYRLADVANEELDIGKLDVEDIDEVWENDPVDFARYNVRDVEATVGINEESQKDVVLV